LQESTVQATESTHTTGAPGWQPLAGLQVSAPSQNRPFEHAVSFGV
jgi:hypothetical protein